MPLLVLITCFGAVSAQAAVEAVGTVASVGGLALIRRAHQTATEQAPPKKIATNEPVYVGDVLSTGSDGSLKMIFVDNTIIDLGPQSMFKVENFGTGARRSGLFTMLYGRLRALVTKAVSDGTVVVRTPDALMGVRGTEFVVMAPASFSRTAGGTAASAATRTQLTVVSGSMSVTMPKVSDEAITVPAGTQLTAITGSTTVPAPIVLDRAILVSLASEARVADNTFERTVSLEPGVQNEDAPLAATPLGTASADMSGAREGIAEGVESAGLFGPGVFGALDSLNDAPASLLPGNLIQVNVTLRR